MDYKRHLPNGASVLHAKLINNRYRVYYQLGKEYRLTWLSSGGLTAPRPEVKPVRKARSRYPIHYTIQKANLERKINSEIFYQLLAEGHKAFKRKQVFNGEKVVELVVIE